MKKWEGVKLRGSREVAGSRASARCVAQRSTEAKRTLEDTDPGESALSALPGARPNKKLFKNSTTLG